ncbi:MAG: hypothetical protein ACREMY_05065 [bacterium]
MTSIVVPSEDLSRILWSALAFTPARSHYRFVRLSISMGWLEAMASDSYSIGSDSAPGMQHGDAAHIVIDASEAKAAEQAIRAHDKCNVAVSFTDVPTQRVTFRVDDYNDGEVIAELTDLGSGEAEKLFKLCDSLLEKLDPLDFKVPNKLALRASLLAPFLRLRFNGNAGDVLDFYVADPNEPILVRYGATFVGAIMPIAREEAPEGSLWQE